MNKHQRESLLGPDFAKRQALREAKRKADAAYYRQLVSQPTLPSRKGVKRETGYTRTWSLIA